MHKGSTLVKLLRNVYQINSVQDGSFQEKNTRIYRSTIPKPLVSTSGESKKKAMIRNLYNQINFMLSSTEHEIFLLISVKMPTIVGMLAFVSGKNNILGLSEPKKADFLDIFTNMGI